MSIGTERRLVVVIVRHGENRKMMPKGRGFISGVIQIFTNECGDNCAFLWTSERPHR